MSRRFPTIQTTMFVCFSSWDVSLFLCSFVVWCVLEEGFFSRERKKKNVGRREEGGATTTTTKKRRSLSRGIRRGKSRRERTALVWSGRGRALVGAGEKKSWIDLSFFKRESAFEEWLTPQKRELFFEDFSRSFSFLAKRVVHRRSRGKREKAARVVFE